MGKTAVVIKGDGIGPESVDSMLGILSECGFSSEIIMADAGSEQWEKNGRKDPTYIPDSTMDALKDGMELNARLRAVILQRFNLARMQMINMASS